VLALDDRKPLGEEEMKVVVAEEGRVQEISRASTRPPPPANTFALLSSSPRQPSHWPTLSK
jgi:hypothetical protein